MCTLSVIALADGYRVVMNRDEQRARAPGLPPEWREVAGTRAIFPSDPTGGGTWIAVGERGLTLGLTNLNPRPYPLLPPGMLSRGTIIPRLIACKNLAAVRASVPALELDRLAPFRLVGIAHDGEVTRVVAWRWDRERLHAEEQLAPPACFVSSGLGDEHVRDRLSLFTMQAPTLDPFGQDAFHRHTWPGREDVSVLMSRDDARTVSITTVEVRALGEPGITMRYHAIAEAQPLQPYHRA